MQTVTRFEANLLRLLYYFLGREPAESALALVENRCTPPPCLGRPAVRLVKEALAKGCTFLLARRGGWRVERHCAATASSRADSGSGRRRPSWA